MPLTTEVCNAMLLPSSSVERGHHWPKLEAIQRWSAICCVWPWTLTYQKFLLCISSQGQDLYSHQKLNMHIYWFSSESDYRRRWRRLRRTLDATVQPVGRHIANEVFGVLDIRVLVLNSGIAFCGLGFYRPGGHCRKVEALTQLMKLAH